MEKNSVTVLIYGQEYNLAGDMPREYILKLADKVDAAMKELDGRNNQSLSATAVLAAMSIADEYFKAVEESLGKDLRAASAQNDAAVRDKRIAELEADVENLRNQQKQLRMQLDAASAAVTAAEDRANAMEQHAAAVESATPASISAEAEKHIEELENRCRDIESSFFDLQMENIHLKNELEHLKNR